MKKVLLSSLVLAMLFLFTFVSSSAAEPTVYTEGDWMYITLADNNARIIDYTGTNPVDVTVPGTLGGCTVTEMGGLEEREGVFDYAYTLTKVTLPDSIKEIGQRSFYNCAELIEIDFPNELETVGYYAFAGCTKLPNLTLPNTVSSFGQGAFSNCEFTEFTVPPLVTELPESFLERNGALTRVNLPSGLRSIGKWAFYYCPALPEITIPDSVTDIGIEAFRSCNGLLDIVLPNNLTNIGGGMFYHCRELQSVTIPGSVKTIGSSAFFYCTSLKEITLPEGVQEIALNAFYTCVKLDFVSLPSTLKTIGGNAFESCTSLKNIDFPTGVSIQNYAFARSGLTAVTIPSDVELGNYTFSYCRALEQVTFQSGLTTISEGCFSGCKALKNVTLPAGVNLKHHAFSSSGLTSINIPADAVLGGGVFINCEALLQVTLGSGVQTISSECFSGCTALKGITLPDGIKIQDNAFALTGLTSVTIPADAELGYAAFSYCPYLQQVTLQPGLKALSANCFMGAKSLNSITIPGSVKDIPSGAFAGCALVQVNLEDGVTSIGKSAFPGCTYLHMIRIPRSVTYIAPGGTEDGAGPFAMSKMTVIYGYLNSVAHFASYRYSIPFVDLDSGQQNPLPTLTVTSSQGNTIDYLGSVVLESNMNDVKWSSDKYIVRLVPDGNKVTVYSNKFIKKTDTVTVTATWADMSVNYELKIRPSFLQWLQIIFLFGWFWM